MLTEIQKDIVKQNGNLIVKASAGTGKTHTMVHKIMKEIDENKTHKVVAAITFTIKAAEEIKKRIIINTDDHFIGTNNSFAIEEIINPFFKDVYGRQYDYLFDTDYSIKVNNFQEGLEKMINDKLICSYYDNKKNFVFQLALNILKESKACQLYLKAKYFKIYIDEYQDCDVDMHKLFMFICNHLNIDTFIVGDEKQSIYIWRGAYPQAFLNVWNSDNFNKRIMRENFRSCQQIQNYSNLLNDDTIGLYEKVDDLSSIIILCTNKDKCYDEMVKYLDDNKTSAILRYSNTNAKTGMEELNARGKEFVYIPQPPISDISTSASWLYNLIANYCIIDSYSEYDFLSEMPGELIIKNNKRGVKYIKEFLTDLEKYLELNADIAFANKILEFADALNYEVKDEHIKMLYKTIKEPEYHPAFSMNNYKNVSITFHSSKGLEYDQVILFAEDYRLNDMQSIYNHYVASTRAKSKLVIVYIKNGYNDGIFANNLNKILAKSNLKARDILTVINCK